MCFCGGDQCYLSCGSAVTTHAPSLSGTEGQTRANNTSPWKSDRSSSSLTLVPWPTSPSRAQVTGAAPERSALLHHFLFGKRWDRSQMLLSQASSSPRAREHIETFPLIPIWMQDLYSPSSGSGTPRPSRPSNALLLEEHKAGKNPQTHQETPNTHTKSSLPE